MPATGGFFSCLAAPRRPLRPPPSSSSPPRPRRPLAPAALRPPAFLVAFLPALVPAAFFAPPAFFAGAFFAGFASAASPAASALAAASAFLRAMIFSFIVMPFSAGASAGLAGGSAAGTGGAAPAAGSISTMPPHSRHLALSWGKEAGIWYSAPQSLQVPLRVSAIG